MIEQLLQWDRDLLIYLNNLGSSSFDDFWLFLTKQLNWLPFFLFLAYLVFKKLGWRQAVLLLGVMAVMLTFTDQTTNLVKNSVERLRPSSNPDVSPWIRSVLKRSSFSFFSGHACNTAAAAMLLFLVMRRYFKYMGLIFLWPLIFAYSRIYLGVHYPIDILCGFAWGAMSGILFYQLYKWLRDKYLLRSDHTAHA